MSDKEKQYVKKLAELPAEFQEKIYDKIDGAGMLLELQRQQKEQEAEKHEP